MASIIWRNKQRKWYAYFYNGAGKKIGRPLSDSVPRRETLSKRERDLAKAEAIALAENHRTVTKTEVDLETAAAYWLDDCQVSRSMRTVESYKARIKNFIQHVTGGARVALVQIDSMHVRAWRDARMKSKSAATVNNDLKAVSAFFAWAVREELIGKNPALNVVAPRREFREAKIPTAAEVREMLALLNAEKHDNDFRALGIMGALCGMRRNEILSLRWVDVSFEGRFLRIELSKSANPRNIPMCDTVYQFLMDLPQDGLNVFPSIYKVSGQKRSPAVARKFNSWLSESGFGWTHKALRHFFNDSLRRSGLEAVARRHVIGHTSEAVNRIYCHPSADEAREYVQQIQSDLLSM